MTAPAPQHPPSPEGPERFVNRELSWLEFNRRVLDEARDASNPVLEQVKFLAIASTNLDEFFEVRVAGTMELVDIGVSGENPDPLNPREELDAVRGECRRFYQDMHDTWRDELVPGLAKEQIHIRTPSELDPSQSRWLDRYFEKNVYPILTPLAVDPAHPFPTLLNKSLNVAVLLLDPRRTREVHRIAVVQVPRVLSRLVEVPTPGQERCYVFMADIVAEHVQALFPGLEVLHACAFRVTRDGNLEVDEYESADLLTSIEQELINRRRGEPVRLEIDREAHPEIIERFLEAFGLAPEDMYFCDGPVNLGRIMELYRREDRPDLKDPPHKPRKAVEWTSAEGVFATLRERDLMLHLPYESFNAVEDFIYFSANDPKVLALKLIIYRAGSESSLVESLITAAQARKQVTVVVELKARFDEEANIRWARRLEKAGVHVVYGIVGLKTHAKACLVVRREEDRIRRYCHLSTGNYNPATARLYTDVGIMTSHERIGEEVADLFNMITGYAQMPPMEHLVAAPFQLRKSLREWIAAEIDHHGAGRPSGIRAKVNSLADPEIIEMLYAASQAGVPIELCVRGICCLRPGIPGLSENIRVVSVVDRFLEHPRAYYFENGGDPRVYLASADWMVRNLSRRVEVAFPVLDRELRRRVVDEVIDASLRDNVKAREILPDGGYRQVTPADGVAPMRSQEILIRTISERGTAPDQAPPNGGA